MSTDATQSGPPLLDAIQRRVLGVLMEKSLTNPAGYPMTMNSLVTGCNQLTCRDPVMQVSEGDVARALHTLQTRPDGPIVRQADVDRTARSNRFEHLTTQRFAWDQRQRAIMAELLLRGPQTAGELKTNASRMARFDDLAMVVNILEDLARHDPPYVRELPRQPGRSTVRFDHLLYAEPPEARPQQAVATAGTAAPPPAGSPPTAALESRVAELENAVTALQSEVAQLRQQIAALEGQR